MKMFLALFLLLFSILPVLSGCWNQKELTDLAFVMALGVDKGKNHRFDVAFQIVNPGNVSAGQGQGGGGLPIAVYKSSGDTLTEAARNAALKVSRRLYYAHCNLLVIGEKLAKEGILDIFDALERDPGFRTTTEIVIARDSTAEELVTTLTILDKLPVSKVTKELQTSEDMLGETLKVNIDDFITSLVSKGKQPLITGYSVIGDKKIADNSQNLQITTTKAFLSANGIGLFRKGKLIGWINGYKARGAVWVLNKVSGTDVNIDWNGKKNAINVTPLRSRTKVSAKIKNGKPMINVVIKEESIISEINTNADISNPNEIAKIEKKVGKVIKSQVIEVIKEAQNKKCDIFGFGEKVHLANPKLWKRIQNNWDEQFSETKVFVTVKPYQRRSGVRRNPFWNELKQ
ncbi:MAG: Ger(x)C family spore germination protein [Bacillota bacterium]|nr:Ger(x)C family spore germination protein [Bacillota bacterium]